ncbi:hypothetical protein AB0F77_41530 [Streptomyces sp. NPDC026672]|uniref:hypothetical protein n=1 Tax=unclassified Streptomyces TaxID=2593676 RepID=UPI0033DA2B27
MAVLPKCPAPPSRPRDTAARTTPPDPAQVLPLTRFIPFALLVVLLVTAAQHTGPAPYGDRFTPHTAGAGGTPLLRIRDGAVEAYDPAGPRPRWRYARDGRRALAALPTRGSAIALWDDGLVTGTDGRAVRWHRALPDAAGTLRARGATGVLRPLGHGMLAVVTPRRVTGYRTADGDLRWVLPARPGCAFRPERAVRHGAALLVAQPCAAGAWTAQLIAVDDLGRIAPGRAPLGNGAPRAEIEHRHPEKVLAPPR